MKIKFLTEIQDLEQQPIRIADGKGEDGQPILRPLTLRDMAIAGLMDPPGDPKSIDGAERQRRTHFADRIFGAKEPISITPEESAQLKILINASFDKRGTLAVGRAWDLLDGEASGKDG